MQNIEIIYPIKWIYKIIGTNKNDIKIAINDVFYEKINEINIVDKNRSSSNNKFVTLECEIIVHTKEERDLYYTNLKKHSHVAFAL